jgi:phosphoglucosamine mutase
MPLFGSSGIRGIVGQDLTEEFCYDVARALGTLLPRRSRVCVATDTRVSRDIINDAVISGLRKTGVNVTELGILPTPALAFITGALKFDTGIMITASHNPSAYNGMKLFNRNRMGYSRRQEKMIENIFRHKMFRDDGYGELSQNYATKETYFRFFQDRFGDSIIGKNLRVLIDPGNGAAAGFATGLFSRLGLSVFPLNDEPDGLFPGRSPEPRADTLGNTVECMRGNNIDIAVCFDGDADRVVFLDKDGFVGLNEAITFIAQLAVIKSGKNKVAATVETGILLDLALAALKTEVMRGRVGDVHLAYLTKKLNAAIGVEPVGVYIMPEIGYYPDSMYAAITLLSSLSKESQLREFLANLPQLYFRQENIPCPNTAKKAVMKKVRQDTALTREGRVTAIDGIRLDFHDSWLLIRASGTEPLIRICAESNSLSTTEHLLRRGVTTVQNILSGPIK